MEFHLPHTIHLGTCSWAHPFWKNQIYFDSYKNEKDFNLHSLREYSHHPDFQCVEIDSTFYAPPKIETLESYSSLVPSNFKFIVKIWERISIPVFPQMKRYGKDAGRSNDSFLDPDTFNQKFLSPFLNSSIKSKVGLFFVQFPKMSPTFATSQLFFKRLDSFMSSFPSDLNLGIEVRNSELLSDEYFSLLNKYKVTHCFSCWDSMPSIITQMKQAALAGGLSAPLYFARLLTPRGMGFEEAGDFFQPFTKLKTRDLETRKSITKLVRRAIEKEVPAYIVINNRFEGNSPLSIHELTIDLCEELKIQRDLRA